mmetsp:Transcript_42742/g.49122  ORF Transcript_42742/g.49122 Transcript_42742/m.49122 type:complete len:97 (+) Transcript_42742:76-366(+)
MGRKESKMRVCFKFIRPTTTSTVWKRAKVCCMWLFPPQREVFFLFEQLDLQKKVDVGFAADNEILVFLFNNLHLCPLSGEREREILVSFFVKFSNK